MNWEAISAIGQIIGALAVVISLIYLAREVRSNARATREALMRSISDGFTQWIQQLSAHPELRELYYRGIHDYESLEGADQVGFGVLMFEMFRRNEELYYLRLEGQLGSQIWLETGMREFNAYPGVQAWWRLRTHFFTEEYVNYVNELQRTAGAPRMFRKPKGR